MRDCFADEALRPVLESTQFEKSETAKRLLEFLWENREREVSEFAIAVDALNRREDFDSRTDASVRVQISRLRLKLSQFYETDGKNLRYRMQIPVGSHHVVVTDLGAADPVVAVEQDAAPAVVVPVRSGRWKHVLVGAVLVVCLIEAVALVSMRRAQAVVARPTLFWKMFFEGTKDAKIVLPTPTFFIFLKRPRIHIRDTGVNDFEGWAGSDEVRQIAADGGAPVLEDSYTVTSDTLAAVSLARYLDAVQFGDRITFATTEESSHTLLEHTSVLALGGYSTLAPFRSYLNGLNFRMAPDETWIDNAAPESGEPARFTMQEQNPDHRIEPALVAILPGHGPGLKLLLVQARHTSAVIEMLDSGMGDDAFSQLYKAHGRPKFFEMVVLCEVNHGRSLRTWPVALRAASGGEHP